MWLLCLATVFITALCLGAIPGTLIRAAAKPPVTNAIFVSRPNVIGTLTMTMVTTAWAWSLFAHDDMGQLVTAIVTGVGVILGAVTGYQLSGEWWSPSFGRAPSRGGAVGLLTFIGLFPAMWFLMAYLMDVRINQLTGELFFETYGILGILKLYGIPTIVGLAVGLRLKGMVDRRTN